MSDTRYDPLMTGEKEDDVSLPHLAATAFEELWRRTGAIKGPSMGDGRFIPIKKEDDVSLPDIKDMMHGDGVTILCTVAEHHTETSRTKVVVSNGAAFWVPSYDIVSHIPRPHELKVGDTVKRTNGEHSYVVTSAPRAPVNGPSEVAMWHPLWGYCVALVSELVLVEKGPE